jgi:hypothetical protein
MRAYCTSCGAPMEADDRHCPRCGRLQTGPLVVRTLPQADEAPPQPQASARSTGRPQPEGRIRPMPRQPGTGFNSRLLLFLGAALVLVIFAGGLAVGRLTSSGGGQSATAGHSSGPVAPQVTTPTPSASPTATPTPVNPAQFEKVNANINGRCSSANGCNVSAVFRNKGSARGPGTARLDVVGHEDSVVYASCTAPIPATDPGATAEVSCSANSPELANYWRQGPRQLVKPEANAG